MVASEVKKATTGLRNEVQETTDALDRYKEIQDTLKELEEGTTDWKKALQESNAEVLKLLENIPELAKYIENNSGQLTVTTEGMEFIEKANEDRLRNINLLEFEVFRINLLALHLMRHHRSFQGPDTKVMSGSRLDNDQVTCLDALT